MATNSSTTLVQVHCIPDNLYAVSGVLNTKRARFDIETQSQGEDIKRTPLNLALILDRGGSMESDNKFLFAKKAVINVLNFLDDDDIVHLVAYNTDVSVIFEDARAATRQYLYTVVDNLTTVGSTNMYGALEVGAELLNKYVHDGFARRMFLFSDGHANTGKKTRAELTALDTGYYQQGIITDSFGIGADIDSGIMKGIADAGGSRFFFLETAQVIESLVSKALVSVSGVLGSQTRLIIRGINGAVVTKIWDHENIAAGASLGDLHSNNLRSILCEFTTTGIPNGNGKEVETLTYKLRYAQPNNLNGELTVIENILSLKFVDDETLIDDIDPRVRTMHATQTRVGNSSIENQDESSRRSSVSSTADIFKIDRSIESDASPAHTVSRFWYKEKMSRHDANNLLKTKPAGTFLIRNSEGFPGSYGLAIKLEALPPGIHAKPGADPQGELVRHHLIERTPTGHVRLKGYSNEPDFENLSALVYQHTLTPLALPTKLVLPTVDIAQDYHPVQNNPQQETKKISTKDLVEKAAACNVVYLNNIDVESLADQMAVAKAMRITFDNAERLQPTIVNFKVSNTGITLTDMKKKLFSRRHFFKEYVTYCGLDNETDRYWTCQFSDLEMLPRAKCFGFVSKKLNDTNSSQTENECHIFAEIDPTQPSYVIVNFVSKVMIGSVPVSMKKENQEPTKEKNSLAKKIFCFFGK